MRCRDLETDFLMLLHLYIKKYGSLAVYIFRFSWFIKITVYFKSQLHVKSELKNNEHFKYPATVSSSRQYLCYDDR